MKKGSCTRRLGTRIVRLSIVNEIFILQHLIPSEHLVLHLKFFKVGLFDVGHVSALEGISETFFVFISHMKIIILEPWQRIERLGN